MKIINGIVDLSRYGEGEFKVEDMYFDSKNLTLRLVGILEKDAR